MTSVLYERVKVDNFLNIFNAVGKKLINPPTQFQVLNYAQW